ncbi:ribosomal-protein-alanine N-acetyltransferase [Thalassoglobus neptunius]|uniref:Ribosomal-protein-alanine N-acetyltransferase n=2 Tax=Thalassoglobus neptunius TaxID=1938619 RepID=A0A5C5X7W7_9PLAN|nr:ribosomal-protein-alanine N-acetyltransferase [Thalassoglobus neptunius]
MLSRIMSTVTSLQPKFLKRFRMEIDFLEVSLPRPDLPDGYTWSEWHPSLLHEHALAKFLSFHNELDSQIFPALRTVAGCRDLMRSIANHKAFLPQSTWLIRAAQNDFRPEFPCGTIQGLTQSSKLGAIQNIGIIPEHRGLGLGRALVLKNLHCFRSFGMQRVYLDVSAENEPAVELYRSIGFRHVKTSYREIVLPLPKSSEAATATSHPSPT